jgi:hypothetical protein
MLVYLKFLRYTLLSSTEGFLRKYPLSLLATIYTVSFVTISEEIFALYRFLVVPYTFILPGIALQKILYKFAGEDFSFWDIRHNPSNLIVTSGLSIFLLSLVYILLNFFPLPITSTNFIVFMSLVIVLSEVIPKFPFKFSLIKAGTNVSSRRKMNKQKDSLEIVNFLLLFRNLLAAVFFVMLFLSPSSLVGLIGWPLQIASAVLPISTWFGMILILILGIPFTVIFWFFLVNPSLLTYSALSEKYFQKSHLKEGQVSKLNLIGVFVILAIAITVTSVPYMLQFLPPGFDTSFHLVQMEGLYRGHFKFPFPIPGRLRGTRPGSYIYLAALTHLFQVDALAAQGIYVASMFAITGVALYSLISLFHSGVTPFLASLLWVLSLPSLHLTWGLNANLLGLLFFILTLFFLLRSKCTGNVIDFICFEISGIFLILTHDLMFTLYIQIITAWLILEIACRALNKKLKGYLKHTALFALYSMSPFLITSPYLIEYMRLYALRIFPFELAANSTTRINPLEYGLQVVKFSLNPLGWFGPSLIFLMFLGICSLLKPVVKDVYTKLSPLDMIILIYSMTLSIYWLSPVLIFKIEEPVRALSLMSLPISYFLGKALASGLQSRKPFYRSTRRGTGRFKTKGQVLNLTKPASIIATVFLTTILSLSSIQYATGIIPNLFLIPQGIEPASIPSTGLTQNDYNAIMWLGKNYPGGTVLVDSSIGAWPAVLTNHTTLIFWNEKEFSIWRKTPFYEKRFSIENDGKLTGNFMKSLITLTQGQAPLPFYFFISPRLLYGVFPKSHLSDIENIHFLTKIQQFGETSIYKFTTDVKLPKIYVTVEIDGQVVQRQLHYVEDPLKVNLEDAMMALNLSEGLEYRIVRIPSFVSYDSIYPEPGNYTVDSNKYVNFTGSPHIDYIIYFKANLLYQNLLWKEDSFLDGWSFWDLSFASDGDVCRLTKKKPDYGGVEKHLAISYNDDAVIVLKHRSMGTGNYNLFLILKSPENDDIALFYPKKFNDEYGIGVFTVTAEALSAANRIRFVIEVKEEGLFNWEIDYVFIASLQTNNG